MADPTRPVSHAAIESAWGQAVHDRTFAPSGVQAQTTTAVSVSTTYLGLDLDTAISDPGGYLDVALTQIEIPSGRDGLYLLVAQYIVTSSVNDQIILGAYALNGTIAASVVIYGSTGVTVTSTLTGLAPLSAGDILDFRAKRIGAPNVNVAATVSLVIVGSEFGA